MTVLTLELITRFTKYVDSHVVCYLIKYIVIIMNKYIIMYFLFFFVFFWQLINYRGRHIVKFNNKSFNAQSQTAFCVYMCACVL